MNDINKHKVIELPDCAYYIPNFVTRKEESELMEKIYSSPKPKWKTLLNRRLQNWGGIPHPKGMILEELPEWLMKWVERVGGAFGEVVPNHVLVNEYQSGQGIMPHEDGPLFHPVIATITLGSHGVLDYYKKEDNPVEDEEGGSSPPYVGSLLLEGRSLLVVEGSLYSGHLHGIQEVESDLLDPLRIRNLSACHPSLAPNPLESGNVELKRGTRVSLTIRHVPRTLNQRLFFGGR